MNRPDMAKVLDELGGISEDIYDELIEMLVSQGDAQMQEIRSALARGDNNTISRIAHTIKGSAGNLRVYAVQEAARDMEAAAKNNNKESVEALANVLEKGLKDVKAMLGKP